MQLSCNFRALKNIESKPATTNFFFFLPLLLFHVIISNTKLELIRFFFQLFGKCKLRLAPIYSLIFTTATQFELAECWVSMTRKHFAYAVRIYCTWWIDIWRREKWKWETPFPFSFCCITFLFYFASFCIWICFSISIDCNNLFLLFVLHFIDITI